jgi:hypothetical protein
MSTSGAAETPTGRGRNLVSLLSPQKFSEAIRFWSDAIPAKAAPKVVAAVIIQRTGGVFRRLIYVARFVPPWCGMVCVFFSGGA